MQLKSLARPKSPPRQQQSSPPAPSPSLPAAAVNPGSFRGGVQLINAGKLTVCSDVPYEPFEFQKDGQIVGFDMDIAKEIAKDLKAELSVVDSSFEAIETGTALTGCDLSISSVSITDVRKSVMDFSNPYMDDDLTLAATTASGDHGHQQRQGQAGGRPAGHHRRQVRQPRRGSTRSSSRTPGSWSRPSRPASRCRPGQPVHPGLRHQG